MHTAIYARYSSESQRQESIEDQIFTSHRLAHERIFMVLDNRIYTDYVQSGPRKDHLGFNEIIVASNTSLSMLFLSIISRGWLETIS